jgi:hypothetical protein
MEKLLQIKKLLFLLLLVSLQVEAFQVDLEGSFQHKYTDYAKDKTTFEKASITMKKILSDEKGDWLHLFLKLEAEDNFQENNVDQLYAKYKGPMGRWNIALGRSLIPFGLLTEYDSEMLILETQEEKTIGYRNDDGIKLSGFWKSMDYALLASSGKWMKNDHKYNKDKIISLKTSFKGYDLEDPKFGFSFFSGQLKGVQKNLFAVDVIKHHGLLVNRTEFVFGKHGRDDIHSLFSGIDYSIFPSVDLNIVYSHFKSDYEENAAFLGITYHSPFYGLVFRAGNKYHFKNERGENKNEVFIQIYKSYSSYF